MLNHIVLQGRLTRAPEIRYTQQNVPVATYTLAVDRGYKSQDGRSQADFINCVAWEKRAMWAQDWLSKGRMIIVEGSLQTRRWQTDDGQNRTAYEVNVHSHHFCDTKRADQPPHPADSAPPQYASNTSAVAEDGFTELPDSEGVPF